MFQIAVISGSLRKSSTNTGILRAIIEENKKDKRFEFTWIDIKKFPVFN
jgi:NAD(P)H-dependent FMN reductase